MAIYCIIEIGCRKCYNSSMYRGKISKKILMFLKHVKTINESNKGFNYDLEGMMSDYMHSHHIQVYQRYTQEHFINCIISSISDNEYDLYSTGSKKKYKAVFEYAKRKYRPIKINIKFIEDQIDKYNDLFYRIIPEKLQEIKNKVD